MGNGGKDARFDAGLQFGGAADDLDLPGRCGFQLEQIRHHAQGEPLGIRPFQRRRQLRIWHKIGCDFHFGIGGENCKESAGESPLARPRQVDMTIRHPSKEVLIGQRLVLGKAQQCIIVAVKNRKIGHSNLSLLNERDKPGACSRV